VIDECHRGSAAEDSAWREILEYFSSATQIGLTATPKETKYVSNIHYFGDPVYSYSLKQGIRDGFLAPYKVVKVHIDRDVEGQSGSESGAGRCRPDRRWCGGALRGAGDVPQRSGPPCRRAAA
jgi:type I site-specific restriction endonuclease